MSRAKSIQNVNEDVKKWDRAIRDAQEVMLKRGWNRAVRLKGPSKHLPSYVIMVENLMGRNRQRKF